MDGQRCAPATASDYGNIHVRSSFRRKEIFRSVPAARRFRFPRCIKTAKTAMTTAAATVQGRSRWRRPKLTGKATAARQERSEERRVGRDEETNEARGET